MRTQTKEAQRNLSPPRALEVLREGNRRFVDNLREHHDLLQQVNETREEQFPFAVILSCMDSRTSAELIFDQGLGDIFSVRVAGNCLNEDVLGSMEFACKIAGSRLVVVLGHTKCGAVTGACDDLRMGNLSALLDKIRPAVEKTITEGPRNSTNEKFVEKVATNNVIQVIEQIPQHSPILKELLEAGEIGIVGGIYDVNTGVVTFLKS